jgi:hypothetical protein
MQKKQLMMSKPAYRHGQLLLEEDFIDEQQFHIRARYRHARALHGFGVVEGLQVSASGDMAVVVSAGYAVDHEGREIELQRPETLELTDLPAGALAWVTIGYRTERSQQEGGAGRRIDCYATLRVATGVEATDVRLAAVQLDENGKLARDAIQMDERDELRTVIAPGSVTPEALSPQLRKDWVTMAFHPSIVPPDAPNSRPPFRIGATQAEAHIDFEGKPNPRGAAGTMAIVLPPGIRQMLRFRVAGSANSANTKVLLVKGGFDQKELKHLRDEVLTLDIAPGGYFKTAPIPDAHRSLADRRRTLSVDIRSEGFIKVSMIAIEVAY